MPAPAIAKPYLTLAEANAVLDGNAVWDEASDARKEEALSYGRAYMDIFYRCDIDDEDDAPADVKMANALLALEFLKGTLFNEADRQVTMEKIKVADIEISESYGASGNARVVDPFPAISAVLAKSCTWKSSSFSNGFLIRA